jgi:hypothetical protein
MKKNRRVQKSKRERNVVRVQELRRSNAPQPHRNRKKYSRKEKYRAYSE